MPDTTSHSCSLISKELYLLMMIVLYKVSYKWITVKYSMSTHVLFNLLNELKKKMQFDKIGQNRSSIARF